MHASDLPRLAIIGGGPAGLMAAETAIAAGVRVDLYDAMGSVGRKFLIAGKGGLNLTHSEPYADFLRRYGARSDAVRAWLDGFDADALRAWARELGVETFVGTSGRVFPFDLKAAPLLRGWVRGLRERGVRFHVNHRWTGWTSDGALRFDHAGDTTETRPDAVVLALGGGSWPVLGSDGAWTALLAARGVDLAPLAPSNCGFDVDWTQHYATRHAGAPIKPVAATWREGEETTRIQGEFVISKYGVEGSLIYALSARLRDGIARDGSAQLMLDLLPGRDAAALQRDLERPAKGRSLSSRLERLGLSAAKTGLLYEMLTPEQRADPATLAAAIKALPLTLRRARPLDEAISTAGGVRLEALDAGLMLRDLPGVFCAGEMLDWEAPTGGYLLTACYASGRVAGAAAAAWLQGKGATP